MYIGNTPTQQAFTPAVDVFSGNGSTTAFTLSRSVASVAQVEAVVENVPQSPVDAFTVNGTTITFTSAPPSGSSNIYVRYTSPITQTAQPGQGTVGTIQLADAGVTPAKLANSGAELGMRNRIINGNMAIDQRNAGAAQTITTAGGNQYTVDRWFASCTGANVTGQRVAGTGANQYNYRFTGATSVTNIYFQQRIESVNMADLVGSTVTFSVNLANSLLTTVNWVVNYPTATDNYSSVTAISSGSFTVNSTLTQYTASFTIPAGATTGLQIYFYVGAQTSGTWTIGNVQLEKGSTATPFENRSYSTEFALCQRYYEVIGTAGVGDFSMSTVANGAGWYLTTPYAFIVTKRAAPTMTKNGTWNTGNTTGQPSVGTAGTWGFTVGMTSAGAGGYSINNGASGCNITASAEL